MVGRSRAKQWCFTLNNYTDEHQVHLRALATNVAVDYLIFGREVGLEGTHHLQGYIVFTARYTFNQCKNAFIGNPHLEVAKGNPTQASLYCKKEGDFEEFGVLPVGQGKRSDLRDAYEFIKAYVSEHGRIPSDRILAESHPSPFIRSYDGLMRYARALIPVPKLRDGPPRPWQQNLCDELLGDANDRSIIFIIDSIGNIGKTWFQQWFFTEYEGITQILGCGKRDDMAYALDESKKVYLFNVARGEMQFLQFGILEGIKDRIVCSPKYESRTKILQHVAHVVVFTNEIPPSHALSIDRFDCRELVRDEDNVIITRRVSMEHNILN